MSKTPDPLAAAPLAQEQAAIAPTGPNPSHPNAVPGGAVELGGVYVAPLADPNAAPAKDGRHKAPFAFVNGVLVAQDAVEYGPELVAQPDALAAAGPQRK